jgi:NADPH-dependent 2,4-dienoyl-CoA reductase/sulfur reductase-like enzyme
MNPQPASSGRPTILIVGAGPAGLSAAIAAAPHAQRVLVLDDNPAAGGQIWRQSLQLFKPDPGRTRLLAAFQASGAELRPNRRVVDAPAPATLRVLHETPTGAIAEDLRYDRLIVATGARERFLPFPGWTLPGVFGAGGLDALARTGFDVRGKRIAVAGTGPLLIAVGAHLRQLGASIVSIAEQAPLRQLLPFAAGLCSHPSRVLQGLRYKTALARVPYRTGTWPVAAHPAPNSATLHAVTLTDGRRRWDEPCDLLACGFHLVPNTELATLLGCALDDAGFVVAGTHQRTSQPEILCAGEPTGIAGLEAAQIQGTIAGLTAVGRAEEAAKLLPRATRERRFAQHLAAAFALRPELRSLAAPDTIVCRCEDVPFHALAPHTSWTAAKLQTRCGMGTCQARICGPAVQTLFGWNSPSLRPPLFPMPIQAFVPTPLAEQLGAQSIQETP